MPNTLRFCSSKDNTGPQQQDKGIKVSGWGCVLYGGMLIGCWYDREKFSSSSLFPLPSTSLPPFLPHPHRAEITAEKERHSMLEKSQQARVTQQVCTTGLVALLLLSCDL